MQAEQIQKQQQNSQQMIQEMMNSYMQLLNTPGSILSGQAEQQLQIFQQTVQQWMELAQQQQRAFRQMTEKMMNTYTQSLNTPSSYVQKGLRSAQFPIEGYDGMNVDEVTDKLESLSKEQLKRVREYEKRHKNRDTIRERLDRKINGNS